MSYEFEQFFTAVLHTEINFNTVYALSGYIICKFILVYCVKYNVGLGRVERLEHEIFHNDC